MAKKQKAAVARPMHDKVLVERVEEEESLRNGIVIPDSAKERPQEGVVVAVGPGRMTDAGGKVPIGLSPGDHVLFGKYSGTEVVIRGLEYLILREDEILVVL